jgi:hypothetical protein
METVEMVIRRVLLASLIFLGFQVGLSKADAQNPNAPSIVGKAVTFSCNDTEATIKSKGAQGITFGATSIYIGYRQVSSNNKNPIVIRFQNSARQWCREDYEVTGDDGTGYGLLWDGAGTFYGVFSATGTQGSPSQDFRRFATGGWLNSYGNGGGGKVAILAKIDPTNGNVTNATFVTSLLPNSKSNSFLVNGLSLTGSNLTVQGKSWAFPRRANKSGMTCSGSSPFAYTAVFTPLLNSVTSAVADRCS